MNTPQNPLDELQIPDGTTVEEHDVVTDGDILIGSNSTVDFGLRGRTIAAGERVTFGRQIEADGDCRLDMWCTTDGSVLAGEDAYIGERVEINGQLLVSGDLDIGDDVSIEEGFEANGWIVTRNPVPVLVFYFIILSQFLRLGDTDKADEFASALAGEGIEERSPLVIPRGAELSDDAWRVSTPARIGDDCRLHGNIRAESITIGEETTVFGSLRARDDIEVNAGTVIIGDVTTRGGTITLSADAHVRGDVACEDLVVNEGAAVDGTLRARGEMKLIRDASDDTDAESAADDDSEDTENDATDDDADVTGPKMVYTTGDDAADKMTVDNCEPAEASGSVGAAYTVGSADASPEPTAEPDATETDATDETAATDHDTLSTVGAAYLAGDSESETVETETVETAGDEPPAVSEDSAVIITDAENDDIAIERNGGETDADPTNTDR
ncbi:MAG: putative acyltransferase [Halonotius sp. J07HN4]|nr:MAG: putative acyltransferase [Halonotius sp. J07HN4]